MIDINKEFGKFSCQPISGENDPLIAEMQQISMAHNMRLRLIFPGDMVDMGMFDNRITVRIGENPGTNGLMINGFSIC